MAELPRAPRLNRALAVALSLWTAGPALAAPGPGIVSPVVTPGSDVSGNTAIPSLGTSPLTMAQIGGQTLRPEALGAYGDGYQLANSATIAPGSTSLSVAYSLFRSADVGKYIEIPGAGTIGIGTATTSAAGSGYNANDTAVIAGGTFTRAATLTRTSTGAWVVTDPGVYTALPSNPAALSSTSGSGTGATFTLASAVAPLAAKIVSVQSQTQATLDTAATTALSSQSLTVTYCHDDTTAVQNAINAVSFVELTGGHLYCVRNLTLRSVAPQGQVPSTGIISRGGQATIRAITGGDTSYLIASPVWTGNGGFSANPTLMANISFDGGNIARDSYTDSAFASLFRDVFFRNAVRYGHYGSRTSKNGSTYQNNTANQVFIGGGAENNGSNGYQIDIGLTDSRIIGTYTHTNGGYGFYGGTAAGLILTSNHTDTNTNGGLYADGFGFNTVVTDNIFEDGGIINSLASATGVATFGPGNTLGAQLGVYFKDNTSYESFRSLGNTYINIAGGFGSLYQGYNGPSHMLITEGDSFQGGGVGWAGGLASTGRIVARGSYARGSASGNTGMALLDGLLLPTNANPAPTSFSQLKYLSNTGTTTTYTITAIVASASMAGFTASGTLDVWSLNSSNAIENYTADLRIEYMRTTGATSVKAVQLLNPQSTGTSVSAAATITDTTASNANNTVTVTVTITHPQATDQYSSGAMLTLSSRNRALGGLVVN